MLESAGDPTRSELAQQIILRAFTRCFKSQLAGDTADASAFGAIDSEIRPHDARGTNCKPGRDVFTLASS